MVYTTTSIFKYLFPKWVVLLKSAESFLKYGEPFLAKATSLKMNQVFFRLKRTEIKLLGIVVIDMKVWKFIK